MGQSREAVRRQAELAKFSLRDALCAATEVGFRSFTHVPALSRDVGYSIEAHVDQSALDVASGPMLSKNDFAHSGTKD